MNKQTSWTSARLALVAVLGAVNGVLTTPIGLLWTVLNNAFGVIGAAVFQPFQIFTLLAAWLMPIRGVFLVTGVVSGFANFLSGDPSGITTLYWGVSGGVAGEVAMLIVGARPERRSILVIVAALLYIPATNVVTFFVYGWEVNAVFFIGIVLSLIAIVVESSLPAIGLGRWVIGTGLLRTAPVPLTATSRRAVDAPV